MLKDSKVFSSFSVKDQAAAKDFYSLTLGLEVEETPMGLNLKIAGGTDIFVYPKEDHTPATFTILNYQVDDIDKAVDALTAKGVQFERYQDMTDEKGIARGRSFNRGPDIAWFKDPSGNVMSVLN
jgi:catechol 2,3-dioxygenase-like lactoylglutathione lyase family enzyme